MRWEELKRLTPRRYAVMVKMHVAGLKRRDAMTEFMVAQLTAVVRNLMADKNHQVKTSHFMPSQWEEEAKRPKLDDKVVAARQLKVNLRAFLALRQVQKAGPPQKT